MKRLFLPFCLMMSFIFLFTQCKKDETTTPTNQAVNYSPLTTGSNWTYNYTDGSSSGTETVTATDKDTSINGKTYKVLSSSDNSGNKYLAKIDSNYYRFASFPPIGSFEELYLKDNLAVNGTWKNSVTFNLPPSPVPLAADLTYVIQEKGITHAVNGKTYNDVIHVHVSVSVYTIDFGGGDFYYAKDVGLIENSISLKPTGQSSYSASQQLVSYEIK